MVRGDPAAAKTAMGALQDNDLVQGLMSCALVTEQVLRGATPRFDECRDLVSALIEMTRRPIPHEAVSPSDQETALALVRWLVNKEDQIIPVLGLTAHGHRSAMVTLLMLARDLLSDREADSAVAELEWIRALHRRSLTQGG